MKKFSKKQEELLADIMDVSEAIGVSKAEFGKAIVNGYNSSEIEQLRDEGTKLKIMRNSLIKEFKESFK